MLCALKLLDAPFVPADDVYVISSLFVSQACKLHVTRWMSISPRHISPRHISPRPFRLVTFRLVTFRLVHFALSHFALSQLS